MIYLGDDYINKYSDISFKAQGRGQNGTGSEG